MERTPNVPLRLNAGIQHYAWGDPEFIPQWLGRPNPDQQPWAEMWIGTHPDLPSTVVTPTGSIPLSTWIAASPVARLGQPLAPITTDGSLPFLLKILTAAQPLSIQVHPNAAQAKAGFERENAAGIPLSSPTRNFRDPHHKPELIVALSDFFALSGFRPHAEILDQCRCHPELTALFPQGALDTWPLPQLYAWVMQLPSEKLHHTLLPWLTRLQQSAATWSLQDPEYWVLKAHQAQAPDLPIDRGLISVLWLKLIHLKPGHGLFVPAGVLHAYLKGAGIEIMAPSNNVLRGGLTPKHMDVDALLAHIDFNAVPLEVHGTSLPETPGLLTYPTPSLEFLLQRIQLHPDTSPWITMAQRLEILLPLQTETHHPVLIEWDEGSLAFNQGEPAVIPAGLCYRLSTSTSSEVLRATIPHPNHSSSHLS